MVKRLKKFLNWMNERIELMDEYDNNKLFWILSFLLLTSVSATIYALGNPTRDAFFDHFININKFVLLNIVALLTITYILSVFFSMLYLRFPRVALSSFLYAVIANITILYIENSGTLFSFLIGFLYSLFFAGIFYLLLLFVKYKRRKLVFSLVLVIFVSLFAGKTYFEPKIWSGTVMSEVMNQFDENPAEKGPYAYSFYTYGSGNDIQRDWFGKSVDEITPSVDASHFITKWGEKRTKFWGFTEKNLPINGRVWVPEGEGPFPVILMVHGNHTMEYLSTSGYDYLGEQLATRGFIAISVDEDFINYSNIFGSPNRNYELRAWIMMQHLAHLQRMNETKQSFLYQKIDFHRVGLMGHSRGGQAVAMVSDYERFFSDFGDDELLERMKNIHLRGIVAIAPTDRSINHERPHLKNVSYLLIHGARDADVNDFSNEAQFYRTTLHPEDDSFRASVYIEKANHTQFNADWGRMDLSVPRGLFLNRKQMMSPKEQQEITKLYMTAFFERVFHEKTIYDEIFKNSLVVKKYLPDTHVITKHLPASYRIIESFTSEQSFSRAEGFTNVEKITPKHRRGTNRLRDALSLKWKGKALLPVDFTKVKDESLSTLVITMANATVDGNDLPEVTAEIITGEGKSTQKNITDLLPFTPVIQTKFTHYGLFDRFFRGDRYANDWEPVFQTFHIPIEEIKNIEKVILHFGNEEESHIMLQEIGVY